MLMVVAVTIGSYMWSEMCDGSPIANDSMRGRNEDGSRIWAGVLMYRQQDMASRMYTVENDICIKYMYTGVHMYDQQMFISAELQDV
jgi:hypothetical protein